MPTTLVHESDRVWNNGGRVIMFLRDQVRSWAKHVADFGIKNRALKWLGLGLLPLFTQKYHGDINIVPDITLEDVKSLLRNPTDEEYEEAIMRGERMTWPKISEIRRRCSTELLLLDCLKALEERTQELEEVLLEQMKLKIKEQGYNKQQKRQSPSRSVPGRTHFLMEIPEDGVGNLKGMRTSLDGHGLGNGLGNYNAAMMQGELDTHGPTFRRQSVSLSKLQSKLNKRVVSVLNLGEFANVASGSDQKGDEDEENNYDDNVD